MYLRKFLKYRKKTINYIVLRKEKQRETKAKGYIFIIKCNNIS